MHEIPPRMAFLMSGWSNVTNVALADSKHFDSTAISTCGSSNHMLKVLQSNRVTRLLDSGVMALFVNGALVASGPSPGEPGGCGFAFALGGATLAGEQDLGGSFILETAVDFSKIRVSRAKRGHGSLA